MNYLCRVCGEPSFLSYNYNYFQELCCNDCTVWVDDVIEYTRVKLLNTCGSYEIFNLLAQVDYTNRELFN